MSISFNKSLSYVLGLLLVSNVAFGISSEYKNTLTKLELTKTSEGSYNVNLQSAKEFNTPVKVIKKNDLSYYILLPETNTNAKSITINNSEIKNIETSVLPYAGSEANNGYTKINITTQKPINFTVTTNAKGENLKLVQKVKQQEPQKEVKKEIKKETPKETQKAVQVPNNQLVVQNNSFNETTIKPNGKKKLKPIEEGVSAPKQKTKTQNPIVIPENDKVNNIEIEKVELSQKPSKVTRELENKALRHTKEEVPSEILTEDKLITEEKPENIVEETTKVEVSDDYINNNTQIAEKFDFKTQFDEIFQGLKEKTDNLTTEYGVSLRDFLLMLLAGVLTLFVLIVLLSRKRRKSARIKNKSELVENNSTPSYATDMTNEEVEDESKYFIFDKNVKQTELMEPTTSEVAKTYELSSYSPNPLENNDVKVVPYNQVQTSENDIINKALQEENIIEIPQEVNEELIQQEVEETNEILVEEEGRNNQSIEENEQDTTSKEENELQVQNKQNQKTAQNPVSDFQEPLILSNVEIAPQRGFMCVSYNNNISLVGYIFDEVFALHNFKQPKLENYNIKFRMSEKTVGGANFIVRVEKTKMLVSVTKSSMKMEVVM